MAREIAFTVNGKRVFKLKGIQFRKGIAIDNIFQFIDLGVVGVTLVVFLLLGGLNFLFTAANYSGLASAEFYTVSILALGMLISLAIFGGTKYLKDLPLVLTVVMFSIVNMISLLLSISQTRLVGASIFMINSGLTVVSIVLLTYYIGLRFGGDKWRVIVNMLLGGAAVALLASVVDFKLVGDLHIFLVGLIPVWLIALATAQSKSYRFAYGLAAILNLAVLIKYLMVGNVWAVIFVAVAWVLIAILSFKSDPLKQTVALKNDLVKFASTKSKLQSLQDLITDNVPFLILITMAGYVLLALAIALLNKTDLLVGINSIVRHYQLSISLVGDNFLELLTGAKVVTSAGGPFISTLLQLSGLVGVISFILLAVAAIVNFAKFEVGKDSVYKLLIGYMLIGFVILAPILPLSSYSYILWWIGWGVFVAAQNSEAFPSIKFENLKFRFLPVLQIRKREVNTSKIARILCVALVWLVIGSVVIGIRQLLLQGLL